MNTLYEKLDDRAQRLLEQSEALALPVSLGAVAGSLGLAIEEKPLEEEFSGFLAVNEKTIVINLNHALVRRRFTAAHEIGHYVLHRKKNPDSPVFIDRAIYYRRENDTNSAINYRMEMEANAFAAGLLMPSVLLEKYLGEHTHLNLGKAADIKSLADEFYVSRPAMEFRLRNLGFVLPTSF